MMLITLVVIIMMLTMMSMTMMIMTNITDYDDDVDDNHKADYDEEGNDELFAITFELKKSYHSLVHIPYHLSM